MKDLKKALFFIWCIVSFVGLVGGIGTLYYCDVESSDLFASLLIPAAAGLGVLAAPHFKRILLEEE